MALTDNGKIAVLATAKEAISLVWQDRKIHIILSYLAMLPATFMIWLGWLDPIINLEQGAREFPPGFWPSFILFGLWGLGWSVLFNIFWIRLFLLGREHFLKLTAGNLASSWIRLIWYVLCITIVGAVVFALSLGLIGGFMGPSLQSGAGVNPVAAMISSIVLTTAIVFTITFSLRVSLALIGPAIQHKMPLRQSWQILTGHTFKLFLTLLALLIPFTVMAGLIEVPFILALKGMGLLEPGTSHHNALAGIQLILSPLRYAGLALSFATLSIIYKHFVGLAAPETGNRIDMIV